MSASSSVPQDTPLLTRPRAVIVGASSGIGAALAIKLAQEGYLVALLARSQDKLDAIAQRINQAGGEKQAFVYPHDVTEYDQIPSLFQTILRDLNKIDVLVYVSGAQFPVGISEFDFEKDRSMLEVNLLGAVAWLGQAALLFERMGAGQIVGISSVAADRGRVGSPAYNASKAGLSTYLEALRNRLTRHGVNVLTIKPGFVNTKLFQENAKASFGVISPERAANAIWRAMRKRKQQIYTPGWWRWVMLAVKNVPSIIFRRLSF